MADQAGSPQQPKRILLGTDLSARCDRALDRASSLSAPWGAELTAVHAIEGSNDLVAEAAGRIPSRWQGDLSARVSRQLRRDLADRPFMAIVEHGDADSVLLRLTRERGADLIVTGLARDELLGRFGLGNTVDRLVRKSPVPVLVVKDRDRGPYRQILVATDFSDSALTALRTAVAYFPDAQVSVLNVFDAPMGMMASDPEEYRRDLRSAALRECDEVVLRAGLPGDRRVTVHAEYGDPAEVIRRFVEERDIDVVALGTHGRSAIYDILIGSTARSILASLPCDALVVPEPRARSEGPNRSA